jgi:glucan-binding YG repeat protein
MRLFVLQRTAFFVFFFCNHTSFISSVLINRLKGVIVMNKWVKLVTFITLVLFLAACSSSSKSEEAKMSSDSSKVIDSGQAAIEEKSQVSFDNNAKQEEAAPRELEVPNQMVIYQADLQLRVKKFEQTLQNIEEQVIKYGGYISESNVSKDGVEQVSGQITVRIPQKNFQAFLREAEGQAAEVLQRNITGTDVTEEYVDLDSRLKSKRVVEERLTSFMKTAQKTEDLLKISADLAAVQEEIETIQGRMKYLENQTALSTIHISLFENKVIVPNLEEEDLNTWDKTKKQFMNSTNMLLAAISWLFVFMVGNLPVLVILAVVAVFIYLYIKKVQKRNGNH